MIITQFLTMSHRPCMHGHVTLSKFEVMSHVVRHMNRNFTDVLKLSILTTQHMFLCVDLHHHATSLQNRGKKSVREFLK